MSFAKSITLSGLIVCTCIFDALAVQVYVSGTWTPATTQQVSITPTSYGYTKIRFLQNPPYGRNYWIKAVGEDIWVDSNQLPSQTFCVYIFGGTSNGPDLVNPGAHDIYGISLSGSGANLWGRISGSVRANGIELKDGTAGQGDLIDFKVDGQLSDHVNARTISSLEAAIGGSTQIVANYSIPSYIKIDSGYTGGV
jgi:hypothetical protein